MEVPAWKRYVPAGFFVLNQLVFSGFLMYLVERTKIIWSLISDYLRIEFQTNEERRNTIVSMKGW